MCDRRHRQKCPSYEEVFCGIHGVNLSSNAGFYLHRGSKADRKNKRPAVPDSRCQSREAPSRLLESRRRRRSGLAHAGDVHCECAKTHEHSDDCVLTAAVSLHCIQVSVSGTQPKDSCLPGEPMQGLCQEVVGRCWGFDRPIDRLSWGL